MHRSCNVAHCTCVILRLSFKNTSKALEPFAERSHVTVWVQRFNSKHVYRCKRISASLVKETHKYRLEQIKHGYGLH